MEYGVCVGPKLAAMAAGLGYDFFETQVMDLLRPLDDEAAFQAASAATRAAPIPCKVLNCFLPGTLKTTGPDVDPARLDAFAASVCRRAGDVGVDVIVFGSGGSRSVPDGFDRAEAWRQVAGFCRRLGPIAAPHRITFVIEPLSVAYCNFLNTVGECADLVREVNHPAIRLLVDSHHWGKDNDSADDIVSSGPLLAHVHVATPKSRLAPGGEPYDFKPFFDALKAGGYDGRVSIESDLPNPPDDLRRALDVMRALAE